MINDLPKYIIISLIGTILLELILSLCLGIRKKQDLLNIILVNILTNPIVVVIPFILNIYYGSVTRHISLAILEILAVFLEGYIYYKVLQDKKRNPYLLSLYLNLFSYLCGLFINYII